MKSLMTRTEFREFCLKRDIKCQVPGCEERKNLDVHHIMERSLWKEPEELGGYFQDNGISLCNKHHQHAEKDFITPEVLRLWNYRIRNRVLPKQLDPKNFYDKWGNILHPPNRVHIKYASTRYLPFSPTIDAGNNDIILLKHLLNKPLVLTVKMDGSNVVLTRERIAARNSYDAPHKSFDMLKAEHIKFKDNIPENVEVFGEWLYARHSIHYEDDLALSSLLYIFAAYDQVAQLWYGWKDVQNLAGNLGIPVVPSLTGIIETDEEWKLISRITQAAESVIALGHEGVVVRSIYPFHYSQFSENVAKYVRPNHVQTDEHWSTKTIVRNEFKPISHS